MSSDESTTTQLSIVSNRGENKDKLKPHKPEPWEIKLIGNFVLDLYHRSFVGINNEWCIQKSDVRKEYSNIMTKELGQKLKDLNGTSDIGTLLHRCGFLLNTPRGCNFFRIKYSSLFEYRNKMLKELDNLKINNDNVEQLNISRESENILLNLLENKSEILLDGNYEVDENMEKMYLEYQRTALIKRKENYIPTNMSCCICEEDFTTMEDYEEHVQIHGEETDFEFLNTMVKHQSSLFKISYRLCKNSHYFCFEIETDANTDKLIIEKIIIVQSRSFYYVHNMRVPYKCPDNGKDRFFVDSHLFTIHVEQPIILIYHLEDKDIRIIEQHHFMRSEEFPKVQFSINPYRLPDKKLFRPKMCLADYLPTKEIQDALKDDFYYEKLMKTCNDFRDYVRSGKILQPHNIGASLNILLQIEDMDTILQYVKLTQKDIKLRSYGDEYSFRLKPKQRIFIENILSSYDEVILTSRTEFISKDEYVLKLMLQNKSDIEVMQNTFVGIIQAVNSGRVSFKCDQKINLKSKYIVICRPSRLNLRYQYRSLQLLPETMDFLKKFLFPTKLVPRPVSNISIELYNSNVSGEQLQAVRNIYNGKGNDATYIIFGPPGTGKTTTLVEGILQLLRKPNTKILVTASSNSACDEIAKRLCKYLKNLDIKRAMVRIYSRSSEVRTETIDDELLENSNMYNGQFYPDIEILHEYRIVICTLSVVAKLATGKFGRSENGTTLYTHLFIDEIAATMEAEALIGITTVLTPKSCLIISGDHKQLGPILKSKRAQELGLGASLMDRLLTRDCYRVDLDTGDYDRTIQTRLIRNYRSHPAIVKLYSDLYYNHSLESYAKKDDVSLCEKWHKSRNKDYPIMFHAIYEPSRTDNRSHSLYNLSELNLVMDYVKDLMYFGINGKPVNENDIGIISPYKKQFQRIQEELNLRKWFGIETGSVETFQGKEKDIIIVSFVRSGTNSLGFLDNPRRLNVTISRPKSLLILIGNPHTLSLNSDFEYIIKECQRNNTFVGLNRTKKQSNLNNDQSVLNKSLNSLKLDGEITNDTNQRRRNGRNKTNNENCTGKKDDMKINENNNNDDDDDDDDESDSEDDSDKASTSASAKNKTKTKNNSRRGRRKNKSRATKGGKITKPYGKDKQKNAGNNKPNLNESEIDTLLNELPRVPTTANETVTNSLFPKTNILQNPPPPFRTFNSSFLTNAAINLQPISTQFTHTFPSMYQQSQSLYPNFITIPPNSNNFGINDEVYVKKMSNLTETKTENRNKEISKSLQKNRNLNVRNNKNNDSKAKRNNRNRSSKLSDNAANTQTSYSNKNNIKNNRHNDASNNSTIENPSKTGTTAKTLNNIRSSNNIKTNRNNDAAINLTTKNSSNTGAIPKTSNTANNRNDNSSWIHFTKSEENSSSSLNTRTATKTSTSESTLKQLNQKSSYESSTRPYYVTPWSESIANNNKTSNNTIDNPTAKSTANIYPKIAEISSADASSINSTAYNRSTVSENSSRTTSITTTLKTNNPPTNPFISNYSPSAPYFNANGENILMEDNKSSQNIRPIRNIAFNKKEKTQKQAECLIS